MENLEELKATFNKYLNNELGEQEARQFLKRMQSGSERDTFLDLIDESLDGPFADQLLNRPELLALLNKSFAKVINTIEVEEPQKPIRLWPKIVASVAALIALIAFGIYFFHYSKHIILTDPPMAQDLAPGKLGATLTLATGKKIRLSEAVKGEIAKEAGISVTKLEDGELVYHINDGSGDPNKINTLTTARGETYILTLPDKSKVWMNAASSLTYSLSLNERSVKLEGEAYFEVEEGKTHPFIVESREQKIKVLGTHFNVNAYTDEEKVTTTLLKGSVKVSAKSGSKILKPGNQSLVNENSISITSVDTECAVAWKNNRFLFENDDIQYIMRMIARWYDVNVVYKGEMPTEKFGGGVSRFDNASQVLKILESTGGAHFKIEGRTIFVSK